MRQETIDVTTSVAIPAAMTRREKLLRWASLVRTSGVTHLGLYHRLEHYSPAQLSDMMTNYTENSAFGVALRDSVLLDAGLGSRGGAISLAASWVKPEQSVSVAGHMTFFELSQQQLHEFSCDCGGAISNDDMANRIERIANAT